MAAKLRRGEPLWPALTRVKIVRRDGAHCLHCGTDIGLTIQHRLRKGAGGSNEAEQPSNGIMLCGLFNVGMTQDSEAMTLALFYGWAVSAYDEPSERPVLDVTTGQWWLLDNAWGRREVEPPADLSPALSTTTKGQP